MFLRSTTRKKDGKEHRYYSVVESVRSGPGARPHQRRLLYLGEINSEQQAQWAKAIEVFEPENNTQQTFSLLEVSVIYRLVAPGSEWRLHRQWYDQSAMKDLLAERLQWGCKDQLYHVLDRLLAHREALFTHLQQRWQDLFGVKHDVLLYDLTSTYFEGEAEENPKAQRGYSRDHRPDCKQIVIALVVTPEGFPLAYETLPGNTQDKTTLLECVAQIEAKYGKADRIWIMDRGIPTEAQLDEIRQTYPHLKYLVGTPRSRIKETRPVWEKLAWTKIRDTVEVKSFPHSDEFYVVAKSQGRQLKEIAMRRRRLVKLLRALRKMRREKSRDRLLMRVGAARSAAGSAKSFVTLQLPKTDEEISRQTFRFKLDKAKLRDAELYDGHYLLRSNLSGKEPKYLWDLYILLVEIEAVFRSFKNDLGKKLVMSRYTQPDDALKLLMARMNREFGEQPPPKLVSTGQGHVEVVKL
jgi:hypothetical protein